MTQSGSATVPLTRAAASTASSGASHVAPQSSCAPSCIRWYSVRARLIGTIAVMVFLCSDARAYTLAAPVGLRTTPGTRDNTNA
jgi:hypothetical protein